MSDTDNRPRRSKSRPQRAARAPLPDTGMRLQGARRPRRKRTPVAAWLVSAVGIVAVFATAGFALAHIAPPPPKASASAAIELPGTLAAATATTASNATARQLVAPTPVFASFRGVHLHLPIPPAVVTVIGFHQASFTDALQMTSLVPLADAAALQRSATAHQKPAAYPGASHGFENSKGVWTGRVLYLWRATTSTKMRTAVDCGAPSGTTVYPPVDGTIMEIHPYHLYGKYPDFEIHIKPDGLPGVDLIMLHVTDLNVKLDEHVIGGVTPIAKVRRLVGVVPGLQLRTYTAEGGDHTHFQINKIMEPGRPWVLGHDPPGMIRSGTD